jgi:uncharacterized repeat protein (TIGR03803 family)
MIGMTQHANDAFRIRPRSIKLGPAFAFLLTLLCALAPSASAQTFSLLHQFKSGPGGLNPEAGVALDAKGNLYGTTVNDGAFASGTVFEITAAGKEKVLYSFTGVGGDGAFPYYGSLARDSSGNLYGTTSSGGIYSQSCLFGCGTVFKVGTSGKETVLYRFTGTGGDTAQPFAGVVRDASGDLYGTTLYTGFGAIYSVDPTGQEKVLYSFTGQAGANPYGSLLLDSKGNVYGTASFGGSFSAGIVFKVDPTGTETVLYSFTGGTDGGYPEAGLIRDAKGNLYGTTSSGGSSGAGTVFKLDPSGTETVLYSFTGGADGGSPSEGSLLRDSAGNLYGTTPQGGASDFGVVFKLAPTGKFTVLHTFSGRDGKIPYGTLVRDKAGNLYGTTYEGGAFGGGVVFKIAP